MPAHGRVGARAFTSTSAARPRSGQRRAGKKEGVLGVWVPRDFCPPAAIFGGVPAALRAAVNFVQNRFGFGSINAPVSNFRLFCLPFRRRFAPPYTGKLARRARRGSPKKGLRQKVKRGEYPSVAPIGYINDVRTKSIVVDRKKAKILKAAFEFYATGNARLEDVSDFLAQRGIISRGGKRIHKTRAIFILSNPFYCGLFRYAGEIYEGKHEPIIAKKLFDKVQEVLKQRGKPRRKTKNEPQIFFASGLGGKIKNSIRKR